MPMNDRNARTVVVTIKMLSGDRLNTIKKFYSSEETKLCGAEILDVQVQSSAPPEKTTEVKFSFGSTAKSAMKGERLK